MLQARDHLRELKEEDARELAAEKKGRAEAEKALVEAKLTPDDAAPPPAAAAAGTRTRFLRDAQRGRRVGPAAAAGRTGGALLAMQPDASARRCAGRI